LRRARLAGQRGSGGSRGHHREEPMHTRRILTLMLATLLALGLTGPAALADSGSPIVDGAVYADGELFGTIILGDLEVKEQNRHSFDLLYRIDGQPSVGEAAPGPGYNGGRWIPVPTEWLVPAEQRPLLTSAADVLQAYEDGLLSIAEPNEDGAFLCPLIPQRR
jgi:hypothetical protein